MEVEYGVVIDCCVLAARAFALSRFPVLFADSWRLITGSFSIAVCGEQEGAYWVVFQCCLLTAGGCSLGRFPVLFADSWRLLTGSFSIAVC